MQYELVTIEDTILYKSKKLSNPAFRIKATQEYLPGSGIGHYKYIIEDEKGNILKAMCSCGSARKGKIDQAFLDGEMKRFWAEHKAYQRYLRKAKQ